MRKKIIRNAYIFLSGMFVILTIIFASTLNAAAAPTPERTKIYLNVGHRYTIDTGKTIYSSDFLTANWYSSDPSKLRIVGDNYAKDECDVIASQSSEGNTVVITVEFEYDQGDVGLDLGRGVLTYYFVIQGDPPETVSLPEYSEVISGSSITLTPTVKPVGSEKACEWSSSDTSVATVSSKGVVKGVSKGTAVITAKTINGLTASCTVKVRPVNMCGNELEWDFTDGVLTISGTGDMYDYDYEPPWSQYNDEITKIVVEEGVTGIGRNAFAGTAAEDVSLPDSLVSVRNDAFTSCSALKKIDIPKNVRSIEGDPFSALSLESISVSPENNNFAAFDGILYNKDMTTLIRYPSGRKGDTFIVPDHVEKIAFSAFYLTELKELYIPCSVYKIDYYGLSTSRLTVYGTEGSAAEHAVNDYVSYGFEMYFKPASEFDRTMVRVADAYGKSGSVVYVPVVLSKNKGFSDLNIEIKYDPSVLSVVSIDDEDIGALFTCGPVNNSGILNMSWDSADSVMYNGTVAVIGFRIISDDFKNRTPIGVSFYKGLNSDYSDGDDVNFTIDFKPLKLCYMNGSIAETALGSKINISRIDLDGKISFTADLSSGENISGTVAAALYDTDGKLCAIKLLDASEKLDIEFSSITNADHVSVMWFGSLDKMDPVTEARIIEL